MAYSPALIETSIISLLSAGDDLIPSLWRGTCKKLKEEVPLETFYQSIYRLRDEGLVLYQSRPLTLEKMDQILKELVEGGTTYDEEDEREALVRLTAKGRTQAGLN